MSLAGMTGFGQMLLLQKIGCSVLFSENTFLSFFSLVENLTSQQLNGIVCGKEMAGRGGGVSRNNHYRRTCAFSTSPGDAFPQRAEQALAFYRYCSVVAPVFLYLPFGPPVC